jgi:hypothetical protein
VVSLRYHLVSLAAVLMALAAGVVLGAGPLANAVSDTIGPSASPSAQAGSSAQAAALSQLQAVAGYDDAAVTAVSARAVKGTLNGTLVVVVVAPGVSADLQTKTTLLLRSAGSVVTGVVHLTPAWTDPTQATVLAGIADQLAPADTKPGDGSQASTSASAFAAAVLATKGADIGRTSDAATALLAGLAQGGFVTQTGSPDRAAGLAVFLGPSSARNGAALAPLAAALAAAGTGAVTAAPRGSAASGGLVGTIRADATTRASVTTVDCVDLAAGRLATVLALARDRTGHHGQYGLGPGADAPLPG